MGAGRTSFGSGFVTVGICLAEGGSANGAVGRLDCAAGCGLRASAGSFSTGEPVFMGSEEGAVSFSCGTGGGGVAEVVITGLGAPDAGTLAAGCAGMTAGGTALAGTAFSGDFGAGLVLVSSAED